METRYMDIWMQVMHTGTESRNKYVSLTITVDKRHHLFFFFSTSHSFWNFWPRGLVVEAKNSQLLNGVLLRP